MISAYCEEFGPGHLLHPHLTPGIVSPTVTWLCSVLEEASRKPQEAHLSEDLKAYF